MIKLKSPIIDNEELEKIRQLNRLYFRSVTLPSCSIRQMMAPSGKSTGNPLFPGDQIIANDEANIVILSDRGIDKNHAPIPALLLSPDCTIICCAMEPVRILVWC